MNKLNLNFKEDVYGCSALHVTVRLSFQASVDFMITTATILCTPCQTVLGIT